MMLGKKGQTFIIAALLISSILIGFTTVWIKTKYTKENQVVYDLQKEIEFEGKKVIDYGVFTSKDNVDEEMTNLTAFYIKANPDKNISTAYGNKDDGVTILRGASQAEITSCIAGTCISRFQVYIIKRSIHAGSAELENGFKLGDITFYPKPDESFYVVVVSSEGGETYGAGGGCEGGVSMGYKECVETDNIVKFKTCTGSNTWEDTICTSGTSPNVFSAECMDVRGEVHCRQCAIDAKECKSDTVRKECINGEWKESDCEYDSKCSNGIC